MRNSTGSPVSRVAVSRPLVKGNEDAGYEGGLRVARLVKPACAVRDEDSRYEIAFDSKRL